jgi:hypothetical protein
MIDRETATSALREVAASHVDAVLAPMGFTRTAKGQHYTRVVGDVKQSIRFELVMHPRHAKESAQLVIRAIVSHPEMAGVAVAMLGPHAVGFGGPGNLVHNAALDQITRNPSMLLYSSPAGLAARVPEIEAHLIRRVVPYLDARASVRDLIALMWAGLSASVGGSEPAGRWPVIVAAGHVVLGDRVAAAEVLEAAYPVGSAERDTYADAFAYLAR